MCPAANERQTDCCPNVETSKLHLGVGHMQHVIHIQKEILRRMRKCSNPVVKRCGEALRQLISVGWK